MQAQPIDVGDYGYLQEIKKSSHQQQGDSLHRQSLPRPQGWDGSPAGRGVR